MTTEQTSAVSVMDLRVLRGRVMALDGVSCNIERGELVGLLGPSGGGKSTLLRSLLGVQVITSGDVRILGHRAGSAALRKRVGYMAQTPAIYLDLTVIENLRYFSSMLEQGEGEVQRVLNDVDLTGQVDSLVGNLSGGQQTRVSLATALLGGPDLLLLDEPTVGLDPLLRRELWQTFASLAAAGTTLIVSSHVMEEATHCARLLLIRSGRTLFDGTPAALLTQAQSDDFDEAFISLIEAAA